MKTIVVLGHHKFGDQQFYHGDELPSGLLPPEAIDLHLDRRELVESERRSLYRLFSSFSGCSESERLDKGELAGLALPE